MDLTKYIVDIKAGLNWLKIVILNFHNNKSLNYLRMEFKEAPD
jgi:hypothetical protein